MIISLTKKEVAQLKDVISEAVDVASDQNPDIDVMAEIVTLRGIENKLVTAELRDKAKTKTEAKAKESHDDNV